jgi:hypothetical protein
MKERPVLFNGEMVRALLDGRKTETRRPIKPQPIMMDSGVWYPSNQPGDTRNRTGLHYANEEHMRRGMPVDFSPWGQPGDKLWVRETFVLENTDDVPDGVPHQIEPGEWGTEIYPHYRATEPEPHIVPEGLEDPYDDRTRWSPAVFMPRWACRIVLEITSVKVERLQEMGENEAIAEGATPGAIEHHLSVFAREWDALYAKRGLGWNDNPWIWVVAFRHLSSPTAE